MNIAIALYKYFPYGGLQKDTLRVAQEAVSRGHQVTIFTTAWDGPPPSAGIQIKLVLQRGFTNHGRMENFGADFRKFLQQEKFTVSLAMNRIAGADFYFAADSCMKTYLPQKHCRLLLHLLPRYRAILRQERDVVGVYSSTKIMYIADDQRVQFHEAYGTPDARLLSLPPGMDPSCRRPDNAEEIRVAMRKELGLTDDDKMLILVGTNLHRKGVDILLESLSKMPENEIKNVKFFLVGKDKKEDFMKLVIKFKLDNHAFFYGPSQEVGKLLLAADLMIHPAREEGTGTVLVEALAAGLPVICTSCCGFANYVRESGNLVIPSSVRPDYFARGIISTLHRLQELKQATQAYASTHDFTTRAKVMIDYLESFNRNDVQALSSELQAKIIQEHHAQLKSGKALKMSGKRNVTRITVEDKSYIIKEYAWRFRNYFKNPAKDTRNYTELMRDFTPPCLGSFTDTQKNQYLIFLDCGEGNLYFNEKIPIEKLYGYMSECGRLLANLHNMGFLHGDTKPANFVVNSKFPKLQYGVCLVDCDELKIFKSLPLQRRQFNLAQFIAGTGRVADPKNWRDLIYTFTESYRKNSHISLLDFKTVFNKVIKLVLKGKHIERNLYRLKLSDDVLFTTLSAMYPDKIPQDMK